MDQGTTSLVYSILVLSLGLFLFGMKGLATDSVDSLESLQETPVAVTLHSTMF